MTPRCEFKVTSRRTCGTALTGIYRYCPEHMQVQLANPMGELTEQQRERADEYVERAAMLIEATEES